jgi:hypothetical protein
MSTDVASSTHAALCQSRFATLPNTTYPCKSLRTGHGRGTGSGHMAEPKQYQDVLTLPEELLDVKERVAVHVFVFGLRDLDESFGAPSRSVFCHD